MDQEPIDKLEYKKQKEGREHIDAAPDKAFDVRRKRKFINRYAKIVTTNSWQLPFDSWNIER